MKKFWTAAIIILLIFAAIYAVTSQNRVAPIDPIELVFINNSTPSEPLAPSRLPNVQPQPVSTEVSEIKPEPLVAPAASAVKPPAPSIPLPPINRNQTIDNGAMPAEMLAYINAERAQANLAPLVLNDKLSAGANLKSQDMALNGYFSHNSPTYGSPFEMMKSQGIIYASAAENIAQNHSVIGAHDAFMNSPGHKANLLNAAYNKIGLGFYQSGDYLYVTQWFTN